MKILQVVPYFSPAYAFGGPMNVAFQVSRKLVKRGHKVVVWTSDAKDLDSRLTVKPVSIINGIKVHYMRNLSMMPVKKSKLFITPELVSKTKEEIKEIDVVHLHEYRSFQNIVVHHYAKKYGVPYVLQAHGSLPRVMVKKRLKWVYDVLFGYRLLRYASKVIAISQTEAQQYRDMGVSEEKIEVIPNGIDLSAYANLLPKGSFKKKLCRDKDQKIILYLGRIHKMKGIDFLIKAYSYLVKNMECNDAILVIAGYDDGYLDEAKRVVASLGISDKVLFTGMLSEKEKISAYVDSSIVVNVEPRNVFGLVPLEAAACSTPVVVSEGNTIKNIIHQGKFGFSIKYGDINELARIMDKMLNDNKLLIEMGEKGRKFVFENHDWANIIIKFEKIYEVITTHELRARL